MKNPMRRMIVEDTVIKMLSSIGPNSYLSTIEAITAAITPHHAREGDAIPAK